MVFVITYSSPTSEIRVCIPARPQFGKLNSNWTFIALNLPKQEDSKAQKEDSKAQDSKLVAAFSLPAVYNTNTSTNCFYSFLPPFGLTITIRKLLGDKHQIVSIKMNQIWPFFI